MTLIIAGGVAAAATDEDAMQRLADATVIDEECRTTNTMYGAVFRYGAAHGIAMVDILPTGQRRREFEAAMNRRLEETPREEICGSLQAQYRQAFPEWFRSR